MSTTASVAAKRSTRASHVHSSLSDTLKCLEKYYDEVPRALATVENLGPFTLFVNQTPDWPYYARPAIGSEDFTNSDVQRVLDRQIELDIPRTFEWVKELHPGVEAAVLANHLVIDEFPLLRKLTGGQISASVPHGVEVRVIKPHDDLARIGVVAAAAFGFDAIETELDPEVFMAESASGTAGMSRQMMEGLMTLVAAFVDDKPVAVAAANPRGELAEVIGVATLPSFRRRGLALAVVAELTRELARRDVHEVFVTAQEDNATEIYSKIGFEPVGTACIAEIPEPQ